MYVVMVIDFLCLYALGAVQCQLFRSRRVL
jgi:hypothetical protein